jgi:hypothetical protein
MPGRTRQRRSYICAGRSLGIFDRRQTWQRDSYSCRCPKYGPESSLVPALAAFSILSPSGNHRASLNISRPLNLPNERQLVLMRRKQTRTLAVGVTDRTVLRRWKPVAKQDRHAAIVRSTLPPLTYPRGERKIEKIGRFRAKQADPRVRIHSAPATSHCEPLPGSGVISCRHNSR